MTADNEQLGEVAASGLSDVPHQETQDRLPGTEKRMSVAFKMPRYDADEDTFQLGDVVTFQVTGVVSEKGEQITSDGERIFVARVAVKGVHPVD